MVGPSIFRDKGEQPCTLGPHLRDLLPGEGFEGLNPEGRSVAPPLDSPR